jgi:hypothetical protein
MNASTYFIDIDGVLLKHEGNLSQQITGTCSIMQHTKFLINEIDKIGGKIILTTGRKESTRTVTESQLAFWGIFYDQLIMNCNRGSRILINDLKPSQTVRTAFAFTPERNLLTELEIEKIITPCEERPWGSFSTLAYNNKYHVKEIKVLPGCKSSLQSHQFRSEVWVVVSGKGLAITGDSKIELEPGSLVKVDVNAKHRVINTGEENLVFVEIQLGEKFCENDITRYEDQFGRI